MTASGTISNLQQALDCAGKCDCCANLQSQINQINARLNNIKPVDEQRIIQASITGAEQLIIPAVIALITQKLAPILARIDALATLVNIALNAARTASTAVAAIASKVAALAAAIAGILLSIAAIQVLGARIDAVENEVGGLSSELSRQLGILGQVKGIAEGARATANRALGRADSADSTANRALNKADNAESIARNAIEKANVAVSRANDAQSLARQAGEQAREAVNRANTAINIANAVSIKADQAISQARTANANAEKAIGDARAAFTRANQVAETAQSALTKAEQAISQARTANANAERAIGDARAAFTRANQVAETAQSALTKASQVESRIAGIEIIIPVLSGAINNIGSLAATADNKADRALAEARRNAVLAPDQSRTNGLENRVNDLDRRFADFVEQNRRDLQLKDLQLSDLSRDFDRRFADFQRLAGLDAQARFDEFIAQNNRALNIRDLQLSNLSRDFDRRFADFQRLAGLDSQARFDEFVAQNRRDLSSTNNRVGALERGATNLGDRVRNLEQTIPGIEAQQRENERLNREGLNKLDLLIPQVAAIPAAAAALIRPAIPTIPQIRTAAASGVCQTTQPGGCLSNALNNQSNNLLNGLRNNLGNVINTGNAAANAAQLAALNRIDTKLGAQVNGGLSRIIHKITTNQAISQIANLVTMLAAIHNVIQLSDNAAVTFFGILDNIFAIPTLVINPEAETIDTREVFNGAIEDVMKSIFGVQEWAQIKQQWQTFNRIYQSSANAINEVRNIGASIINAVEQTATLTGKGFNALQDDGILSELNWDYTPEELKLKGGMYARLGKLADGISVVTEGLEAIEVVTSEIRSAVESANQIKQESKEISDGIKTLISQSKSKREEEVEALPAKNYSWEDLI